MNELVLEADQELGEKFYKFISQNQTITKLSIPAKTPIFKGFNGNHFEYRKELAFLSFTSNNHIVNLLNDFKTLSRFSFTIYNFEQYQDLIAKAIDKWDISIGSNNYVELTRKPIDSIFEYIEPFLDNTK